MTARYPAGRWGGGMVLPRKREAKAVVLFAENVFFTSYKSRVKTNNRHLTPIEDSTRDRLMHAIFISPDP